MTTEEKLQEAKKQANSLSITFDAVLSKIQDLDPQKRVLWKEIYQNAIEDRTNAKMMFEVLVDVCQGRGADLSVHGQTIAKYIERMSRANDQVIKLAELVAIEEQKQNQIDVNAAYEMMERKLDMPVAHDVARLLAEGASQKAIYEQLLRDMLTGEAPTSLPPLLHRYVVLEVFDNPAVQLSDEGYDALVQKHGPILDDVNYRDVPIGTILGIHVNNGVSLPTPRFLFPFLPPHLQLPTKAGEHVWTIAETLSDQTRQRMYYMWRISEPRSVDDINHTHSPRAGSFISNPAEGTDATKDPKYGFPNGVEDVGEDGEPFVNAETAYLIGDERAYERLLTDSQAASKTSYEPVPRYKKSPADYLCQGSNNSILCLGTHEQAGPQDPGMSIADIVVGIGRTPETGVKSVTNALDRDEANKTTANENPAEGKRDFVNDACRVYLALNINPDQVFELELDKSGIDQSESGPAVVLKTDHLRLIGRKSMMFVVKTAKTDPVTGIDVESTDPDEWASIGVQNGDIVFKPSKSGYIKMGGADADKAVMVTSVPAVKAGGKVTAPPTISTMGGATGTGAPGQGTYASKILST